MRSSVAQMIAVPKISEFQILQLIAGVIAACLLWQLIVCKVQLDRLHAGTRCHASKPMYAALDPDARVDYYRALSIKDSIGVEELVASGRLVHIEPTVPLLILEMTFNGFFADGNHSDFIRKVRILEGEYRGRTAWIDDHLLSVRRLITTAPSSPVQLEEDATASKEATGALNSAVLLILVFVVLGLAGIGQVLFG